MRASPRSTVQITPPDSGPRAGWRGEESNRGGRTTSAATLAGLLLLGAAGLLLTSCSSGGTIPNEIALPVITLTPSSASVAAGGVVQFTANVTSPASTVITWSVNRIVGGNTTLGMVSSSGLYTAPATIPSPSTVTVTATSSAETSPFGAATVTVTAPVVNAAVAVAPLDSATPTGSTVQFTATVTGATNTAVTWSVNGVAGGNSTVGTISASGLYTAPAALPNPATVAVKATSQAQASQTAATTVTLTASNTAPLFVNFGLNGNTNNPNTASYNGLLTSVTVCLSGTNECETIPDVLVDTGTVGLRILNSALVTYPSTEFETTQDTNGNQVEECVQFRDASYAWGPVLRADVQISGEKAIAVPFQVLGDTTFPVPSNCLSLGNGPNLDSVSALGANGVLGIGNFPQDCGLNCAGGQTFSGYPYYICPRNVCQAAPVPVAQQVTNPVALFPKDSNGVEILLPSIPAAGAPSLPYVNADGSGLMPAGQLIFGVGTETNNATGSATVYGLDVNGNFSKVVYNGVTYTSGGLVDTGLNALYMANPQTLGLQSCADNPYYCSSATVSLSAYGVNGSSGTISLNVANADNLLGNNPSYAAFNNLAGENGSSLAARFELGLPFFFGRPVFVGIAGSTAPNNASAPNGYVAF